MNARRPRTSIPDKAPPRWRLQWTWELESICAVIGGVWIIGMVQFLHHVV